MTRPPDLKDLDGQIEQLNQEKEAAVAEQDFEKAAHLRDQADKLKKKKENITREWREKSKEIDGVVDEEVVREVVSKMTGVPLTRIEDNETQRLLKMEEEMHKKVISQHEAIQAIAKAVRKSRAGLKDPKRPIGTFIFAGPTGVGKTLLAKKLAEFMFGDENALVQLDMSEYMEKHNVSRLVGAPPGYVGYEEGGQLTEAVRRRPYAVVLLDEIEKAHADVFNTLLQVMDDGRLTDGQGRTVDFKNTVLIMTSNIPVPEGLDDAELRSSLLEYFKPEFINRLDDVVRFQALDREQLREIVDLQVALVIERVAERGINVTLTDTARELLANLGYDPSYGARPLRRVIQKQLTDRLALALLEGEIHSGEDVTVDARDGELVLEKGPVAAPAAA
jgi:ATP-dependent Clp protease ATP-binding subunit ClpC